MGYASHRTLNAEKGIIERRNQYERFPEAAKALHAESSA
jgi:hypothetical protein